jgi:hypothetical protein
MSNIPRRYLFLGAFPAALRPETGLSAPILWSAQADHKYFRFYPLRVPSAYTGIFSQVWEKKASSRSTRDWRYNPPSMAAWGQTSLSYGTKYLSYGMRKGLKRKYRTPPPNIRTRKRVDEPMRHGVAPTNAVVRKKAARL